MRTMIKVWIYRTIGDILYSLNGGLDGIGKKNRRADMMFHFWSRAYALEEMHEGRLAQALLKVISEVKHG